MILVEAPQGSPEWHSARAGAVTASMFKAVRERLKSGSNKGDYTKAAKDYAFRLAIERISWQPLDEGFETWSMRRGRELEPAAREAHAEKIGKPIQQTGLVLTDDERFGASADGLIDEDGGAEYKCLVSPERLREIIIDKDLSDFRDQVQGCLWLTGRKWWNFVLYCPALAPAGKDLIIHEQTRDDDYIEAMERDLLAFDKLVMEYKAGIEASESWHKQQQGAA